MPQTDLLPAAVEVAIAWAKANAPITAICSQRISSRLPASFAAAPEAEIRAQMPWLRCYRAGGFDASSEAPLDQALLQWDAFAFGSLEQPQAEIIEADLLIRTLRQQLRLFDGKAGGASRAFAGGIILGAQIAAGPSEIEEPATGWARFRLDTLMTIKEDTNA